MKTIGRHLIAEFYGCDPVVLNDVDALRKGLSAAAERVGATVMGETFHCYSPQGVSGTVVIAESHLSIHTWPESRYVAVDIYTCGGLDPNPAVDFLAGELRAGSARVQEILRGLPEEIDEGHPWLPEDVAVITRMGKPRSFPTPSPSEPSGSERVGPDLEANPPTK